MRKFNPFSAIINYIKSKKDFFKKVWKILGLLDERIDKHHSFMLASGIAFNIILYMLPLILVAVYVVGLIFGEQGILNLLTGTLTEYLPPSEANETIIMAISKEVSILLSYASVLGYVGIFILLWLSSALISSFRSALNAIYDMRSPHVFILYRVKDMFLTIVFTILILIYSYVLPIVSLLSEFISTHLPPTWETYASDTIFIITSLTTSFILFYFIFRFVPNKRIPRKPRVFATISSVLLIEIGRHVFAWYISTISAYGKFYGAYAVLVSVALWVYYSSLIIVMSAEVSKFFYDIRKKRITIDV